jgi:hypothetical protein
MAKYVCCLRLGYLKRGHAAARMYTSVSKQFKNTEINVENSVSEMSNTVQSKDSPARFPPPEVMDSDFRRQLGTVLLPPLLRTRMQSVLRKEAIKSRTGIEKFVTNHQLGIETNSHGKRDFPFTRGSRIHTLHYVSVTLSGI